MCWQTPVNSSKLNSNIKFSGKSRNFIKGNYLVHPLMPHYDLYTLQYQNYFFPCHSFMAASLGQQLDLIIHLWEFSNSHTLIVCLQYVILAEQYVIWSGQHTTGMSFFLMCLFEDNCFTVLCWFLPNINMNQPYRDVFKNDGFWYPSQV